MKIERNAAGELMMEVHASNGTKMRRVESIIRNPARFGLPRYMPELYSGEDIMECVDGTVFVIQRYPR